MVRVPSGLNQFRERRSRGHGRRCGGDTANGGSFFQHGLRTERLQGGTPRASSAAQEGEQRQLLVRGQCVVAGDEHAVGVGDGRCAGCGTSSSHRGHGRAGCRAAARHALLEPEHDLLSQGAAVDGRLAFQLGAQFWSQPQGERRLVGGLGGVHPGEAAWKGGPGVAAARSALQDRQ